MGDEMRNGFALFTAWYFTLFAGAAGLGWIMLGVEPRLAQYRRLCGILALVLTVTGAGAVALVRWVLP